MHRFVQCGCKVSKIKHHGKNILQRNCRAGVIAVALWQSMEKKESGGQKNTDKGSLMKKYLYLCMQIRIRNLTK